jgi:hypothetical protein
MTSWQSQTSGWTSVTWVANPGSNCSGKADIESVMTHERGHTFGLNHVDKVAHPWLTMRQGNKWCSNLWARTLGLGDMKGLEEIY